MSTFYEGRRFARLVLVAFLGTIKRKRRWRARCDCGNDNHVVAEPDLAAGTVKSCGCFRRARMADLNRTHGDGSPGRRSRVYRAWTAMHDRPAKESYKRLGVTICDEWAVFEPFRDYVAAELGPAPRFASIDRIKNKLGYQPGNIRWATAKQQARNRSDNVIVTIDGVSRCLAEWAEIAGLSQQVVYQRRKRGWPDELAVTVPVGSVRPK